MLRTCLQRSAAPFLLTLALGAHTAAAQEGVDLDVLTRIRAEGLHHSQVMDTVRHLTDEIGPRLTGSPSAKAANDWTRQQLADWGLANAHLEAYDFGRGWSWSGAAVALVKPVEAPLLAVPKAWSPGTDGPVRGQLMAVKIATEKDFEQYRGKVAGKILLLDEEHDFSKDKDPAARRYTSDTLGELARFPVPRPADDEREKRFIERTRMRKARNEFYKQENVVATIESSTAPWGILRVSSGGSYKTGEESGPPALVLSIEQYDRLYRLAAKDPSAEVEIDVKARYYDDDHNAYNTVAEIPGTDPKGEVVMTGAHLDSWHAGTGATDNAAGCAIVMEAVRILKKLGIKPRRTIRVALWTGEEEGLLGSRAYVAEHFGARPEPTDPEQKELPPFARKRTGPFQLNPEHAKLSAYFNVDNGSGKIRGIFSEENAAAAGLFESWLHPLRDLGADTVTMRHTGGTDHNSFDDIGLPGFQFIQDELDYFVMTHHTNMDVYDHLERDDMIEASVVLASFLYDAAMQPQRFPRKPMPE